MNCQTIKEPELIICKVLSLIKWQRMLTLRNDFQAFSEKCILEVRPDSEIKLSV